jgi:hypothetical protein
VNIELERMRKERAIIKFHILYKYFPENTEEEHEKSHSVQSVPLQKFEKSGSLIV